MLTEDGILISPRKVLTAQAPDQIEQALGEQGISLDELIESGEEIRSAEGCEPAALPLGWRRALATTGQNTLPCSRRCSWTLCTDLPLACDPGDGNDLLAYHTPAVSSARRRAGAVQRGLSAFVVWGDISTMQAKLASYGWAVEPYR